MRLILILINIGLHSSGASPLEWPEAERARVYVGSPKQAAINLALKVSATNLSLFALATVERYFPDKKTPTTLRDLASLRVNYYRDRSDVLVEILDMLSTYGLRLNLTNEELTYYLNYGRLPALEKSAQIDSLCLSTGASNVLARLGIRHIGDINRISLEELSRTYHVGNAIVAEIASAYQRVGIPIYKLETERLCEQAMKPPGYHHINK